MRFLRSQSIKCLNKQLRHFSFNESENSSFPSSYNTSIHRQESLNSKATSNKSKRTSNFKVPRSDRKSDFSDNGNSKYSNPINIKNHLKSIAQFVGADRNMLSLPQDNSPVVRFLYKFTLEEDQ